MVLAILIFPLEDAAKVGETFTLLSGFISCAVLILAVISTIYQKEELKLQRDEQTAQRRELRRTADAQEAMLKFVAQQTEAMRAQASVAQRQLKEIEERPFRDVEDRMISDLLQYEKDVTQCAATYQVGMAQYISERERGQPGDAKHCSNQESLEKIMASIRKDVMHWEKYFYMVGFTMLSDRNETIPIRPKRTMNDLVDALRNHIPEAWREKAMERLSAARNEIVAIAKVLVKDHNEHAKVNQRWIDSIQMKHLNLAHEVSKRLGQF
ncbi:MAG: hypothetical protein A2Z34_04180 [Planctomycetes bacterium RBG_16_59_8]|nr:MAG: hypothetical protein A2Z34_04180 [Planctomycetes bacterium RBG_16_59_8]